MKVIRGPGRVELQFEPNEVEAFIHGMGINLARVYDAVTMAKRASHGKLVRLVLPQPQNLQLFGLPVVFGAVENPVCEVEL